jgi:hypothetical protein
MNWKIVLGVLMVSGVIAPSQTNPYEGLKRLAYSTTYKQLHLPETGGKEVLYGVLMDWG